MTISVLYWVSVAFAGGYLVAFGWQFQQALATTRLYGRVPVAESVETLRVTLRGRNAASVVSAILSIVCCGAALWMGRLGPYAIVCLPIALASLYTLSLHAVSPAVLLLGTSRWESVRLFNLVERGIHPYRVVVLLEPSRVEPERHSRFHWLGFEVDNVRVVGHHDWRETVHRMSQTVPCLVLDARRPSEAVIDEARALLEIPCRDKTVFVINDDGTAPVLTAARSKLSLRELRTARIDGVVAALKRMGLDRTTSPDDWKWLANRSYARQSGKIARAMHGVARTGVRFATALGDLEQRMGRTPFVVAARALQRALDGAPGAGALEVFSELNDNLTEVDRFLAQWSDSAPENEPVVRQLAVVSRALIRLQAAIDAAPPRFLMENEGVLKGMRGPNP